jgi:hypothetical protein
MTRRSPRSVRWLMSWALLVQAVHACSDTDDSGDDAAAGAGNSADAGRDAGTDGPSGSGGSSSGRSGSGAGNPGSAGRDSGQGGETGAGGMMGSSGTNGAGSGGGVGLDEVDLTLGGLNQDLPAPTQDCLETLQTHDGCLAMSGEYNGEAIDFECGIAMAAIQVAYFGMNGSRQIGCGLELAPEGEFRIALIVGEPLFGMLPTALEGDSGDGSQSLVSLFRPGRELQSHSGQEYLLSATHTHQSRIAGEAFLGPGHSEENTSEFARGAFAVSLTPLAGCAANAEDLGCDLIRLRGTFSARTITVLTPRAEGQTCDWGGFRCNEGLECALDAGQRSGTCVKSM